MTQENTKSTVTCDNKTDWSHNK